MKTKKILILLVCLALTLSACSSAGKEEEAQATINAMYTSVAETLTVLTQQVTPAPANTAQVTPTLAPSPTQTVVKTPTKTVPTAIPCDASAFAGDVTIPDNTVMTPGQTFTKTWSIKNSGTCDWTTSYKLVFLSGNAMGGASTALSAAIKSGSADNVSVAMVAPVTKGTYAGFWIMQNAAGQTFGESVYVSIVVSTTFTSTPTGTITPTPDLTATANTASTLVAAATALSQTQTAAPTPTPP